MNRWERVNSILDREVERAVKAKFSEMKSVLGGKRKRANGANGVVKPVSVKKVSRGTSAARRQAGTWMGTLRGLSVADKAKAKAVREAKGFRAGLAEAKRLRKGAE